MNAKGRKFFLSFAATAAAFMTAGMLALPASASPAYVNGKLNLISEPGKTDAQYVEYYQGDTKKPLTDLKWVDDGHEGKAVRLDGKNDYLRINYQQLMIGNMSFTAWVNWQGSATSDPKGEYDQPLFSMFKGSEYYLTMFPRKLDVNAKKGDGHQDGLSLCCQFGKDGLKFNDFNGSDDPVNTALPKNEWHHLAVVTNGTTITTYVDGVQWFQEVMVLGIKQLGMSYLLVGDSFGNSPKLNAVLDDVSLYSYPLSQTQLTRLVGGIQPEDKTTELTTGTTYRPTQPTTTTTAVADVPQKPKMNPLLIVILVAGVLLIFSIVMSLLKKKPQEGEDSHEK